MFKKLVYVSVLSLLLMFIFGCASTSSIGKKKVNPVSFTGRAGQATSVDFRDKTPRILVDKYHYQIIRQEQTADQQYIETNWRYRNPFDDELAAGIVRARSKFIIKADPRGRYRRQGLWNVTVLGENEVVLQGSEAWVKIPMTDSVLKYFRKFVDDLESEFRMGIRKF